MLLLDEPTNHLDASSVINFHLVFHLSSSIKRSLYKVGWLERYLHEYKGAVIAVTHDRYFLDNVAGWILEIDRGKMYPFKGNYTGWAEAKEKRLEMEKKKENALARVSNSLCLCLCVCVSVLVVSVCLCWLYLFVTGSFSLPLSGTATRVRMDSLVSTCETGSLSFSWNSLLFLPSQVLFFRQRVKLV